VSPPSPPVEEQKPAPTALVPDAQSAPAPETAPKTIARKPSEPGKRRKTSQASKEAPKTITNIFSMRLVLIPEGDFLMGTPDLDRAAKNQKPRHKVKITRPFYLGATEVTQGQYRAVTGQIPSYLKGSDDLPVEGVSWKDATEFCERPSELEKRRFGGARYRLPTEAEWEYACRAGSSTQYSFGADTASLAEYAWFKGNSDDKAHPVERRRPNAWGLYDMYGNVWERCSDWYGADYYGLSPVADPRGPSQGEARVLRGGCWVNEPSVIRSALRGYNPPPDRTGFRVARDVSGR
jgi:formylglycine-generating enzyme required for sulfatase activity